MSLSDHRRAFHESLELPDRRVSFDALSSLLETLDLPGLLRVHPRFTPLLSACGTGRSELVRLLLLHPGVAVNEVTIYHENVFHKACQAESVEIVRLLLADPRVDVNLPDYCGRIPLYWPVVTDSLEVVKWILASDRSLRLEARDSWGRTLLDVARGSRSRKVLSLLEKYVSDQEGTREFLRAELRVLRTQVAELFSLVVLLSDNFVRLSQKTPFTTPAMDRAKKFFTIGSALPIELQMVLCHRAHGSMGEIVLTTEAEVGFKVSLTQLAVGRRISQRKRVAGQNRFLVEGFRFPWNRKATE